ncbi:MAG: ABC transporter ATP-binding protein [Pseudomonadota bacterium]
MIRLRDIEKTFRSGSLETRVLQGIDLDVAEGEYVALMGASGTGKSTLMNLLGCLDRPTGGTYHLDERDVTGLSDEELSRVRNEKIGFVFQQFHLLPRANAVQNVLLPLVYARKYPGDAKARAEGLLGLVGLGDRMHYQPGQLSGGQQQRVAIARALIAEPRILFADEPTGNLDRDSTSEIMDLFTRLHAQGHSIIMVTHDPDTASRASRILEMVDGRIVADRRREGCGP